MSDAKDLGLGHRPHPLLGHTVMDTATGRTGVLRALAPDPTTDGTAALRAWLAPHGGGPEWTTDPEAIAEADR